MEWAEPGVVLETKGCVLLLDPHWVYMLGNQSSALHAQHILADILAWVGYGLWLYVWNLPEHRKDYY